MSRLIVIAFSCALLGACASQPPVKEPVSAAATKPEVTAKMPERRIPDDSVYPLLLAEFALRRQAYDVALDQYMAQAPLLRDAGVSAHTTHLTQFLQREADALEAAELWVELEPDNAEANNTLAELLARQGRTPEALQHLAVVEEQTGGANFPILLNGFEALNAEQRAGLIRDIDQLAREHPDNTSLLLTQALILTESGDYDAALDELQKLFVLDPEQLQGILLEARLLLELQADQPYARIERVLADNPDAQLLRLQYARLLTATDMVAARRQFEILSSQSPRDGDLLFSLALINRETGDTEQAKSYLREVIALGQRTDEAHYYLGRLAEEQGLLDEALSEYMQVSESREYLAANSRIGQILVTQGEFDRSADWFQTQRTRYPQLREQLYGLEAEILAEAGASQRAMQILSEALTETPNNMPLLYSRAMLSEQQDDLAAMEKDLRLILKSEPDNATALNALGYTLANRTTRYTEAQQLIARALELQPGEPAILDSMGWVMFRQGHYDEAVAYLTRAYAEFPDPEVAAHLGEVLWVKGDTEAALLILQGAALRDPDHQVLGDTLQRLGISLPEQSPQRPSGQEKAP